MQTNMPSDSVADDFEGTYFKFQHGCWASTFHCIAVEAASHLNLGWGFPASQSGLHLAACELVLG